MREKFTNDITNNVLIFKIYKQHIQLNIKKNNLNKTWAEYLNGYFLKKIYRWPTEKCSALVITREVPIQTTLRYHFTTARMAIIKMSTNNKCLQNVYKYW